MHVSACCLRAWELSLSLCLSFCAWRQNSSSDIHTHTHTQRRHLSEYLAEITIQEFAYLAYKPSQIAGSAVCLALHTLHLDTLPPLLRRVFASWGMDMDAVCACARYLSLLSHTLAFSLYIRLVGHGPAIQKLQGAVSTPINGSWWVLIKMCL